VSEGPVALRSMSFRRGLASWLFTTGWASESDVRNGSDKRIFSNRGADWSGCLLTCLLPTRLGRGLTKDRFRPFRGLRQLPNTLTSIQLGWVANTLWISLEIAHHRLAPITKQTCFCCYFRTWFAKSLLQRQGLYVTDLTALTPEERNLCCWRKDWCMLEVCKRKGAG